MSGPAWLNASVGEYRLIDFLGAGGMGEVYRAVSVRSGRVVAIKILSQAGQSSNLVERFYNEARLHSKLRHPNIVELRQFLDFQGRPCIVMEYVEGESLAERIRARGRLSPAEAAPIFCAIGKALAYIHDQGIVHRDLKPTNIRISSSGCVKLLDFGIAKSEFTPSLTQTGVVVGTPLYVSPEQLRGTPATLRSDVWALGILFYEMLSGKVPFEAESITELWEKVKSGTYLRVSALIPAESRTSAPLWAKVDRIIDRCLRREPSERYASAEELVREVSELGAERVKARSGYVPSVAGAVRTSIALAEKYWRVLASTAAIVILLFVLWIWRDSTRAGGGPSGLSSHRIEVFEGKAEVYVNDVRVGSTPYEYRAQPSDAIIRIELRQPGFENLVQTFDVTKRNVWTFAMKREPGKDR